MSSSSLKFFQQPRIALNEYQQRVLNHFSSEGLTAEHFIGCGWFNDFYHDRAFSFLIERKKCSFKEAFCILDKLDKDQARGILQWLSREEVVGLTGDQIDAFLKNGLPKDELLGLKKYQIQVLLALKNEGIKSDDLRNQHWLDSHHHLAALLYLMRIKEKSFVEACDYLKDLNSNEASAIYHGIEKSEVKGLENHLISLLITRREYDGLQSRDEVSGLDQYQIGMVKKLYHFGLTSQMIRDQIKQTGSDIEEALIHLVLERGVPVKCVLPMISGLTNYQIDGLSQGLHPDDIAGLNEYQIEALVTCRTIKNGLTAEDLRGKNWFDSEKHLLALSRMLSWGEFTVNHAMKEMDGLTGDQAEQVSQGRKRDDIVGLTKFQLKALDKHELRREGLTGGHLRGKDWFNSANHVAALEYLLKRKNTNVEDAMNQLDGLNAEQVRLFVTENTKRDIIIKLTPVQIVILHDKYEYGLYGSSNGLLDATWLKTTEQAELLKVLSKKSHDFSMALTIVKHASDIDQVKETLEKTKNGEISNEDMQEFYIDHHSPKQPSSQSHSRSGGCNMM